MGEVSVLFPEGINRLDDLPWTVSTAITQGLYHLGFEELDPDERPPRRIWNRPDEMTAWWQMVQRKRKEKYSGDDNGGDGGGHDEQNAAVKDMIVG